MLFTARGVGCGYGKKPRTHGHLFLSRVHRSPPLAYRTPAVDCRPARVLPLAVGSREFADVIAQERFVALFGVGNPQKISLTNRVIYVIVNRLSMQANLRDQYLTLHDEYADVVFRLCLSKVSSRDEAKDLTQEAFVRVWERLAKGGETIDNLRAFLFTVARNLIKDYYKRKKPVLERDLPEGAMAEIPVASDAATTSETRMALDAIRSLPATYAQVLTLHLVEGYGVGEIAQMLDERPNTISVRVKRGLEKVRVTLKINQP